MKQSEIENTYVGILKGYLENFETLSIENDNGKTKTALTKTQLKSELEKCISELSNLLEKVSK
jgi:hypothetical protein